LTPDAPTGLTLKKTVHSAHAVFMCFVFIEEQTATLTLCNKPIGSALFCDITQCIVVIFTDVSGQPISPIFKDPALEDGTDRLSQHVGKELPLYTA